MIQNACNRLRHGLQSVIRHPSSVIRQGKGRHERAAPAGAIGRLPAQA